MYKLKINGFNANFNGIKKGTITINGVEYQWDNTIEQLNEDDSITQDDSNTDNN